MTDPIPRLVSAGGSTNSGTFCTVYAEFKHKLDHDWTIKPENSAHFVNVKALSRWMEKKNKSGRSTNADHLIAEVYPDTVFPQITGEEILYGNERCIFVFAILLELGCGHLIHEFRRADVNDSNLKLPEVDLRKRLKLSGNRDAHKVIGEFTKKKRHYCPVEIEIGIHRSLLWDDHVLPFCKRTVINEKGGTAQVFQILLQEDFIGEELRKVLHKHGFPDKDYGYCYELALKTYRDLGHQSFEEEVSAFRGLRDQKGLVQYFGNFTWGESPDDEKSHTHNILLEFGEHDLEEYLFSTSPPILNEEIVKFWDSILKVADVLEKIHNLEVEHHGNVRKYNGWHADVKPDNILIIKGEFKLADFGFARFQSQSNLGIPMNDNILGGTITYCAPERDPGRIRKNTATPVSQSIDVWSLGCVFSISATWVVLGWDGVRQFQRLREQAITELRKRKAKDHHATSVPTAEDAFHNGKDVLPEVFHWHNYLRSSLRKSDTLTHEVLNLIDRYMLCGAPSERAIMKTICKTLDRIRIGANNNYEALITEQSVTKTNSTVLKALLSYDDSAPPNLSSPQVFSPHSIGNTGYIGKPISQNEEGVKGDDADRHRNSSNAGTTKQRRKNGYLRDFKSTKTANRSQIIQEVLKPNDIGEAGVTGTRICDSPGIIGTSQLPVGVPHPTRLDLNDAAEKSRLAIDTSKTKDDMAASRLSLDTNKMWRRELNQQSSIPRPGYQIESKHDVHNQVLTTPNDPVEQDSDAPPMTESPEHYYSNSNLTFETGKTMHKDTLPSQIQEQTRRLTRPLPKIQVQPETALEWTLESLKNSQYPISLARRTLKQRRPTRIMDLAKSLIKNRSPHDNYLKNFIKDRDIIFIVDNGTSMAHFWTPATFVLKTLAMELSGLDKDGLDLIFTCESEHTVSNAKKDAPQRFKKAMKEARPRTSGSPDVKTDIGEILGKKFTEFEHKPKPGRKRTTLIILTDGTWPASDDEEVRRKIAQFGNRVMREHEFEDRFYTMEFIRFGEDPDAIERLAFLDDEMTKNFKIKDFINTEPWTGDVYKMILGSLRTGEDNKQTTLVDALSPTSPDLDSRRNSTHSRSSMLNTRRATREGNYI